MPDALLSRQVIVSPSVRELVAAAEKAIHRLSEAPGADKLGLIAPHLMRSEAAASSWMEGVTPSARQMAFAELAQFEDVRGFSDQAKLVANAMITLRRAISDLVDAENVTVDDLVALQRDLLPDEPSKHGLRQSQNWVGGSRWHPLDAAYVPPPPELVRGLMDDLVLAISSGASQSPLIEAAVIHAQFETIHPFADGNGRIGRALIHTVLGRRQMSLAALVPVSLVLMTRKEEYVNGLVGFRHEGRGDSIEAQKAANDWLEVFLRAFTDATVETQRIAADVQDLTAEWLESVRGNRVAKGLRPEPRQGSAVSKLLEGLVGSPVMTVATAQRLFGLSATAASAALAELAEAGVLSSKRGRTRQVYFAPGLIAMLDLSERRLASPDFDTLRSGPVRGVPVLPKDLTISNGPKGNLRMNWSDAASSVWGKTNRDDGSWMRLVQHLEDSAAVAGALWDNWLAPNVRRVISEGLPDGDADGRILFSWLAGIHDVGKASPGFAVKAVMAPGFDGLLADMGSHGLSCPTYVPGSSQKLPPHCRIGQFLLNRWLREHQGIAGSAADAFSIVVGGHHGVQPTNLELEALRGDPWTGASQESWAGVQSEILDHMADLTGAAERLEHWRRVRLERPAQTLLSAAVVVADWLASDERRFPYGDWRGSEERVVRAGLDQALRGPWRPADASDSDTLLTERFPALSGHQMSATQIAMLEEARALTEPGLMVLEAPMGSGKTEAALLAAEELARKFGCGGVFVGLPTMATSDAMFDRVLDWTRHLDSEDEATVFLAHGRARLNEKYQGLVRSSWVRGINTGEDVDAAETAVVTSWLQGRRKGVLANMVVGTVDQALFTALQTRHVALRHLAFAGKVVIIDEVHAADNYMRRYLTRALEWLGSYGTPVILLSATLPPAQRHELVSAYARGRQSAVRPVETGDEYPVITVQSKDSHHRVIPHDPSSHRTVELHELGTTDSDLTDLVVPLVEAEACVLVVRNTVASAQQTFDELEKAVGAHRIMLLHSRFVAIDRSLKEAQLKQLLGPPHQSGVDRPRGFVVVGTQVVEQSLDIDADVLITDHAPTDLILQRIGRLHRHQRGHDQGDRPEVVRAARAYVTGVPELTGSPELDPGSKAVYGASLLLRSAAVLGPRCGGKPLSLPAEIPTLVRATYGDELVVPETWSAAWEAAESEAATSEADRKQRADGFRLSEPRPGNSRTLVGFVNTRASDDPDSAGARAQVRDSEDGLEVVVVQHDSGEYKVLDGPHEFSGRGLGVVSHSPPEPDLALALASYTVRLPKSITPNPRMFDRVLDELELQGREFMGWQQSPFLAGQLVLSLDQQGQVVLNGATLGYDATRGLQVMRNA